MCIDIMEVWFWIANGQILSVLDKRFPSEEFVHTCFNMIKDTDPKFLLVPSIFNRVNFQINFFF